MKLKDTYSGLNSKLVKAQEDSVKSVLEDFVETSIESLEELTMLDYEDSLEIEDKPKNSQIKLSFGVTDKAKQFSPSYQKYKSNK